MGKKIMDAKVMHVDIETYSSVDLAKSGVYAYCEADDFDVILIAYAFDDGPVRVLDMMKAGVYGSAAHATFQRALYNPEITKTAYNANFERTCLTRYYNRYCEPEQWECTMVKALTMGLPGSLIGTGTALGLPEDKLKDTRGKQLIQYFCRPCAPTASNGGRTRNMAWNDYDKWDEFVAYNRQDVITEQAIYKALSKYETTDKEKNLWYLDQRMNDRGVRLDMPMVDKIVEYDTKRKEELLDEAKKITGLENPNSVSQLKEWLSEEGYKAESLDKSAVKSLLSDNSLPLKVRRVLEIRQALGKASVAKYTAMQNAVCKDGRLRGILQFYGANRSGRWAGKIVQTHNLARNTLPDLDIVRELVKEGHFDWIETLYGETAFVFSELIRTAFIPSDGCRFVVSDFSAIEARVISWLAGEEWRLEAFRNGKDIYCETASRMYGVPVVKHGENGELRQRGKVAELACGYQGGVGAMARMDTTGTIPEEELQQVVNDWRAANPKIVKLWRQYENLARLAIEERRKVHAEHGIIFTYEDHILQIQLPSGRKLSYWGARVRNDAVSGRSKIVYHGVNQETKKWEETETYGGKLVENVVQAIARDCLAEIMTRVSDMGYQIVMHVHDEIIVDVPVADKEALNRINAAMAEPIEWAPGLPLKGDGYETEFYKKD